MAATPGATPLGHSVGFFFFFDISEFFIIIIFILRNTVQSVVAQDLKEK